MKSARALFHSSLCILMSFVITTTVAADDDSARVVFENQIQPLLAKKCTSCHGEKRREAGLSLATGSDLLNGGESGPVVVAGMPDESLLLQLVRNGEMPPDENEPLTAEEESLIHRWVSEGAGISGKSRPKVTAEQIVPLMLLRCSACHGGRRTEAGLDLRTRDSLLKGGKSGPAVVPGHPEESLLIRRIHAEEMPPRRLLVSVSVKPMESGELKMLEQWIAAGLPEAPVQPDLTISQPDPEVPDEERLFWSFRPPQLPTSPLDKLPQHSRERVRNPIDEFILEKLSEKNLTLSPEADRAMLIRRVSFDLIGLPPTPEEVAAFVSDTDPLAYEHLVDRLLQSEHFGERWARHWLDVAGYADSEGSQNEDRIRPTMWRYRDYVIRAFNSDKPYDRFLLEQLAGDELADYQNAAEITPEIYDNIAATGFLRTAPDRTFANITNFVPDRLEVIADEVQILGSSVLGLTVHCARCHSHKFDPIPQRDYYRLTAALKDALDEHDWIGPAARSLNTVTTAERNAWQMHEQRIDAEVKAFQEQLQSESEEDKKKVLQEQIKEAEGRRRPEPQIRALWSRGTPSPTFILRRGNYLTPGPEVQPGVPSVLTDGKTPFVFEPPWPGAPTTGRRLALARWLTNPSHPLTARVMVNRMWKHHFGTGIVTTLSNFGKTGAAPSHPELLDWLAVEFVRGGWSMKAMHRLMVNSATYRQSSSVTPDVLKADPENRLLSRMPMRRLDAEAVRDTLLFAAGQLDTTPFGPPDEVDVRGDGLVTPRGTDQGSRRSIYVLHRRTKMPTILEVFDSPQMGPNCVERGESIVATQALHLLNNAAVHDLARSFADRVEREAGDNPTAQVIRVHQLATGTTPSGEDLQLGVEYLAELSQQWMKSPQASSESPEDLKRSADRSALRNYCHAVMNSAAFVYVD